MKQTKIPAALPFAKAKKPAKPAANGPKSVSLKAYMTPPKQPRM